MEMTGLIYKYVAMRMERRECGNAVRKPYPVDAVPMHPIPLYNM